MIRKFIHKYSLIIPFTGFLIFVSINQWVSIYTFKVPKSNEIAEGSISIDINHLDIFPNDFNSYFANNFNLRGPLLDYFSDYSYYIVKKSPVEDEVIIGSDGWLFMGGNYTKLYKGEMLFSPKQEDSLIQIWKSRKAYLDSLDIAVYWIIGPLKNEIYSDMMPFNIRKSKSMTRFKKVRKKINSEFSNLMIDPRERFKESGKKLYYKMDNHWNLTGGNIASEMLIDQMKKDRPNWDIPTFPNFEWHDSTISWGNLKASLGIDHLLDEDVFPILSNTKAKRIENIGYPVSPSFSHLYEEHYKNPVDTTAPRILFFRDSYTYQMSPFLNECFSESLYIFDMWHYKLDKNIVESYKPDAVVFMTVEANLHLLLRYGADEIVH